MTRPGPITRFIAYGLLISGSVVFSFPFLWMAATSMKVDREFMSQEGNEIDLMPMLPQPRDVSPYVDELYYEDVRGPFEDLLVKRLEGWVEDVGLDVPAGLDSDVVRRQVARGVYGRLRRLLSDTVWQNAARAEAEAERYFKAHPQMATEVFDSVYRRLRIGAVRVRSFDFEHATLTGRDEQLTNLSPQILTLSRAKAEEFALARYVFGGGDEFVLQGTFDLPFSTGRLKRIELDVVPDDTWHEFWCEVELPQGRYKAKRAVPLANFGAMTVAWQLPSDEDHSLKIKTWVPLRHTATAAESGFNANQIRVTFTVKRVSRLRAIALKAAFNYNKVFDQIPFWRYLRVSLFLVIMNIVLALLFSSLVAYAFARLTWPGRDFCFVLMLATMMVPPQVTMIPHFLIWRYAGAYDTLTPLWLGPAFGNAFFIFLLRQFMKTIPRDLEDAARIDGCGFVRIYWHIILPLIKPSLAAIAIFTFMGTWNDFIGPLIYIADQRLYPLAFGLYALAVQVSNDSVLTLAAALLMTLPVIVIFFFAQKYFIQGVTLTGMKG